MIFYPHIALGLGESKTNANASVNVTRAFIVVLRKLCMCVWYTSVEHVATHDSLSLAIWSHAYIPYTLYLVLAGDVLASRRVIGLITRHGPVTIMTSSTHGPHTGRKQTLRALRLTTSHSEQTIQSNTLRIQKDFFCQQEHVNSILSCLNGVSDRSIFCVPSRSWARFTHRKTSALMQQESLQVPWHTGRPTPLTKTNQQSR